MAIRFSDAGPEFPEQLVDALLAGEVVFLCGAGVSAPQLPGFGSLVTRCFARLNVEMSASERLSFRENRFEEVLGSVSRRIVNPADVTRAVVAELQIPPQADLSHHRTILRLSRDLENRPAIVTTNFDTLIERALLEGESAELVRALSFAGQDLPLPGGASFGGIIHIHGRLADGDLALDETPLVVTSAEYGDAYMRSGWASRFLFDLCRCRTIVLVGYSAGDAPVRYFLNVLDADRQRFADLRPVYAIDAVVSRDQADVRWAALAVEPISYEYLPDAEGEPRSHEALWPDLARLADLIERPRVVRREWAQAILGRPFASVGAAELDQVAWLFSGRRDLWSIAITTISDADWFTFFADRHLWVDTDAAWILAAWTVRDLQSPDVFRSAADWLERYGKPYADELARRLMQVGDVPEQWLRFWRLLTVSRPDRGLHWEDRAYALMQVLGGPVVLRNDLERAVTLLTPALEIRSGRSFFDEQPVDGGPTRLSDLVWPRLTLADRGGARDLLEALVTSSEPIETLEIASARLRGVVGLAVDLGMVVGDYDANDDAVPSIEPHIQNEHHDGPVFLVELIARLLPSAAASDAEAVRTIAARWKGMPGVLGTRLWLNALRRADLFTANEAIGAISALPLNLFWNVRRELALVLRERAGQAAEDLVAALERRLMDEGATYYARYEVVEGQADWRSHALDAEVWLRLNMLRDAGRLSERGAAELEAITARREYLRRDVEDRDFFGSYTTGVHMVVGDAQPIIDAAAGERLQVARKVVASNDIERSQGWTAFCRTDPSGALDTLRGAPLDEANAPLWRDLIGSLSLPEAELAPERRRLVIDIFSVLEPGGDAFLELIVDRLADLYWSSPRRAEPAIAAWWQRLFATAVRSDGAPIDPARDLYADLINTAGGRLTQAVLVDIEAQRSTGEAPDPSLLEAVGAAAAAPGRQGAMARGALVFATGFVLAVVGEELVPALDGALAGDGAEGIALRRVLVTQSRLSSLASRTFSRHVLRGLHEVGGRGRDLSVAAAKLIAPALSIIRGEQTEADWGIGIAEVASTLRSAPAALRAGAAELLTQWIHQIDDDRATAWRTGIGPLLQAVWPRERAYRERALSRNFAELAVASGEAFPEALDLLLPHISRLEGHGGTHSIEVSRVPEEFPRETLALLWRLFGPGTTSNLHGVPKILERIILALPALELDRRLQWLDQKATRYE